MYTTRLPLFRIIQSEESSSTNLVENDGLVLISSLDVPTEKELPEGCYALKIQDSSGEPVLKGKKLGIFCKGNLKRAGVAQVFAVWIQGRTPQIIKIVKDDTGNDPADSPASEKKSEEASVNLRRKSFMTPTPLHVPDSRVSPIPKSAHEMIFLKGLRNGDPVNLVPVKDVLRMDPLVYIPDI